MITRIRRIKLADQEHLSTNPLVNRFMAQKGSVETFLRKIPILKEAFESKEYYKADQFIREEIQKVFQDSKKTIQKTGERFLRDGLNASLDLLEDVSNKLEYLINKVATMGMGQNGMGSGFKPTLEQMDELLNYDQTLIEKARTATEEIISLKEPLKEGEKIESKIDNLIDLLETFEEDLKKRSETIISIGK